jgi:ribosomal protein L32E
MKRRDLDDDDVATDGERLRVPIMICDGDRSHQPHFYDAPTNEATKLRRQARADYVKQLTDSWKRPPGRDAGEPDASTALLRRPVGPNVGAAAGYRDPDELDPNERLLRGHLREPTENEKNQAKRDASWRDYKTRLSESWRSPGVTDPNAAARIEAQRRSWTAGR